MLAAVAVAAVEAVVGMLEEVAVAVAVTLEAAVVCIQSAMLAALVGAVGVTAVVVCMRGRHAQLTAWVDRVADTSLAGSRMAEPSKFGISLSNFHEREGQLTR